MGADARGVAPAPPSDVVSFKVTSERHGSRRVLIDRADILRVAGLTWYAARSAHHRTLYVRADPFISAGKRKRVYLHRLLLDLPSGVQVDHINGDGLDNRRANLRACTGQQNQFNMSRRRDNRSGFKGVSWSASAGRWLAQYSHAGRHHYVGSFDTPEEAHAAYAAAVTPLHGAFLNTGSPQGGSQ